jgi:POT family proton-dependent oligopeptide transporter
MTKERKHPKGLMVLFFTEMWERFGFYLMLGIFTLYMIGESTGIDFPGMGFSDEKAADIYGTYLALVYLTPFFGGLLADRVLGYRKSITIGGVLMAAGYIGLSFHSETIFYISLLLVIVGNGFFKPNISALVGRLYDNDKYREHKDSGFNIFYMGINVGAFVSNFVAAYLRINYGWGWAFAAAGIGMLLGLIWFWSGQGFAKDIKEADYLSPAGKDDMSLTSILVKLFVPAVIAAIIGWMIPGTIFGANSTDAFLFFSIPVVLFYINLVRSAPQNEKEPIKALLSVMGVVVIFWAIFHQNGSALTLWAERYTAREVPQALQPVTDALSFNQIVTTEPRERVAKDAHGIPVLGEDGQPKITIGPDPYFDNLPKEEWPKSGEMKLVSTELFQSINPGFIIIFTPLVVAFFGFLSRRGKEPSTPAKIGYGLLITALSSLVMVAAVVASGNGAVKASAAWLFGTYAVITIGELFLSPMGLSLVSKLSPPRIVALMMGGWFLSTSIGNKLSGVLSGLWNFYENKAYFFLTNALLAMLAVISIFILLPWLRRVVKENS